MKKVNITVLLGLLLGLLLLVTKQAWAFDGRGVGTQIAGVIRDVIIAIVDVLTPIVNILGVGMITIGLIIGLALRQEFLGFRLVIGGALALLTANVVIPLLLGFV